MMNTSISFIGRVGTIMQGKVPHVLCLSGLLLAVSGCALIPSDENLLPSKDIASAQLAADIHLTKEGWPAAQWWLEYGDAQLNRLMAEALHDSPSLQVTAARIGAAHEALKRDIADVGVDVRLNGDINRQRYSGTGFFPPPIGGSYYTETTLDLSFSHDFDWWGRRHAMIAASLGEVNARRAEHAQAEQILGTAVAQSYFRFQTYWARLDALQQRCEKQEAVVADKKKRVAHGVASIDEQQAAEAELRRLNADHAALEAARGREREALRALIGADNQALMDMTKQPLPEIPHALPASLGMELLARRPDLQAARWRVEASLNRVEAAQAAFYPEINLTAIIGLDTVSMGRLLRSDSRTYYLGPTLSLPIFDSGRLKAQLGMARNDRNEMIADYNQSIFDAVRDVAQEGLNLRGLETQMREQLAAEKATNALLHSAQAKFSQGLLDRGNLLNAELASLQERDVSLQVQGEQLQSEIALIKALGGGYRRTQNGQGQSTSDIALRKPE
jgi:multidrug efflux system outer membrane protein